MRAMGAPLPFLYVHHLLSPRPHAGSTMPPHECMPTCLHLDLAPPDLRVVQQHCVAHGVHLKELNVRIALRTCEACGAWHVSH